MKYDLANQLNFNRNPWACVYLPEDFNNTFLLNNLHVTNGEVDYTFLQVKQASGNCVNGTANWQVKSNIDIREIDCTQEFALAYANQKPAAVVATSVRNAIHVAAGTTQTIVSPYAGLRLENLQCTGNGYVTFYTGVGTSTADMQIAVTSYSCSNLPATYVAFENAIAVSITGAKLNFEVTSSYRANGIVLGPGESATVATSSKADNIQNLHPERNVAVFNLNGDVTVTVNGTASMDPKYGGYIQLIAFGAFGTQVKNFTQSNNIYWSFYADTFEVHYLTTVSEQAISLNMDQFILDIVLAPLPTGLTYPPSSPTKDPAEPTKYQPGTTTARYTPPVTGATGGPGPDPTGTANPHANDGMCVCKPKSLWLDIAYVVETTDAMGPDALQFATASIQSFLFQMTNTPSSDGKFYSRSEIITYGMDAQVDYDLLSLATDDPTTLLNINLKSWGGENANITRAVDLALQGFDKHSDVKRQFTRQVVFLIATGYKPDNYKVIDEFKEGGGTVIVLDYVQPGDEPEQGLKDLASPGYYFLNTDVADTILNVTMNAFCDVNCFCAKGLNPYVPDDPALGKIRQVPRGQCYNPVNLASIEPAANGACAKQKGLLASIHDDQKQFYTIQQWLSKTPYLIGLVRTNGVWGWVDKTPLDYTHWNANVDINDPNKACAYSQQTNGFNSAWFPTECYSSAFFYMCQMRPCDSTYYCF